MFLSTATAIMDNHGHGNESDEDANYHHQQQHDLAVDGDVEDPAVPPPQDRFIDDDLNDDGNDNDTREEREENNADDDEVMDDESDDSDSDATDDVDADNQRVVESIVIPTPEEVELTYTYPNDFMNADGEELHWSVVVRGQYFRLSLDPSCTRIPDHKFDWCRFLIEMIIPKDSRLKMIGKASFRECRNLQRIQNGLPEGLVSIDDYAFDFSVSLQGITIPSTVILVGFNCFRSCSNLAIVTFESSSATSVVEIRDGAFRHCRTLWSVTLPQNLTSIPNCCFYSCQALTNITIPECVEEIGVNAFFLCSRLRVLDLLSEHITLIGGTAFNSCTALETISIRSLASNIQIGSNVFNNCPALSTINVLPSLWPALFESMMNNDHPYNEQIQQDLNFCYKFLHQYLYQIE